MSKGELTFYLYSKPNFITGYGRLIDVAGYFNTYNENETEKEADSKAIHNDWRMVGCDIKSSINKYEQEEKKEEVCKHISSHEQQCNK